MDITKRFEKIFHRCFQNALIVYLITLVLFIFGVLLMRLFLVNLFPYSGYNRLIYYAFYAFVVFGFSVFALLVYPLFSTYRMSHRYVMIDNETITRRLSMPVIFVIIAVIMPIYAWLFQFLGCGGLLEILILSVTFTVVFSYFAHRIIVWPLKELKQIYFCSSMSMHDVLKLISDIISLSSPLRMGLLSRFYLEFTNIDSIISNFVHCEKNIREKYDELLHLMRWKEFVETGYYNLFKKAMRRYNVLFASIFSILFVVFFVFILHFVLSELFVIIVLLFVSISLAMILPGIFLPEKKIKSLLRDLGITVDKEFPKKLYYSLTALLLSLYSSVENKIGREIIVNDITKGFLEKRLKTAQELESLSYPEGS